MLMHMSLPNYLVRISFLAAARLKGFEHMPTFGPPVVYFYGINCIEIRWFSHCSYNYMNSFGLYSTYNQSARLKILFVTMFKNISFVGPTIRGAGNKASCYYPIMHLLKYDT